MVLRIVIALVVVAALGAWFYFVVVDREYEEKSARLIVENRSGDMVTNVAVTLTEQPCKAESIANDAQIECVFTKLKSSDYAISFVKANGETVTKNGLGHVAGGLFWNDKITLGENGEVNMTREPPRSNRLGILK